MASLQQAAILKFVQTDLYITQHRIDSHAQGVVVTSGMRIWALQFHDNNGRVLLLQLVSEPEAGPFTTVESFAEPVCNLLGLPINN